MGVQAGAGRGSAERDLAEPRHRVPNARDPLPDLGRIAAELLPERDRDGVHEMRPAGLHDVVELDRLPLERGREQLERGEELVRRAPEGGEVHRRREDVVRGLAHVDVVVRVDPVARERCDHLVRVHVRARARPGLEDVDRELVVELSRCNPVGRRRDALGDVGLEQAQVAVRRGPQPP